MGRLLDFSVNMTDHADALRAGGVGTVIRYYAQTMSKCLTPGEAQALAAAGLSLAVVYEDRGGTKRVNGKVVGSTEDFTEARGAADAQRALDCADAVGQPRGTAIYFAVDWDFGAPADLAAIASYFQAVKRTLAGRYRLGAYGSGKVILSLQAAGLAEFLWLAQSTGWAGYQKALASGHVALIQKSGKIWPGTTIGYDENVLGAGFTDIGAFVPQGGPVRHQTPERTALYAVTARDGLNLRRGPGTSFETIRTLPAETILHASAREGSWLLVDVEGDGQKDGFVAEHFLRPVAGVIEAPGAAGLTPYQIARGELAKNVAELPGAADNPRIVAYHGSTLGGPAPDALAWCSSFVNWCVTQAGLHGTNSKWAQSWHDLAWGKDVTKDPQEGDIAVFHRSWVAQGQIQSGGHVGFYVKGDAQSVTLLGGNQGDRVSIATYPRQGVLHGMTYDLLSIRRPA